MAAVDFSKRHIEHQRSVRLERQYPGWRRHLSRRNKKLIAEDPADVPAAFCLKCGKPATKQHRIDAVSEDWVRGIITMVLPIYGFYRGSEKVPFVYGLCERHESQDRLRLVFLTLFCLITPFVAIVLLVIEFYLTALAVFSLVWPVGTLLALISSRSISGKPTAYGVEVSGVGKPIIDLLPHVSRKSDNR